MKNLHSFDAKTLYDIKRGKNNIVINNKKELIKHTIEALSDDKTNNNLHLGLIPSETILRIKTEVTDISKNKINNVIREKLDYDLVINQREIRHLRKDSMTYDDVIYLMSIFIKLIINFDFVRYTLYKNSQNALRFKKKIKNETFIALVIISNKKSMLRLHTLFIDKNDFKKRRLSPTLNEYHTP